MLSLQWNTCQLVPNRSLATKLGVQILKKTLTQTWVVDTKIVLIFIFRVSAEDGGRCCNEKLLTNLNDDCCEGIIYKKSLKTCCRIRESPTSFHEHYQLFDIRNGRCCLYEAYDPSSQVCTFDGIVENFLGNIQCNISFLSFIAF